MAGSAKKQDKEPKSGIVAVQRVVDGKPDGEPQYAAAGSKWVVEGLEDGTLKLVEEVPADASQVPAQGDAAVSGNRVDN